VAKISSLPQAGDFDGTEDFPVVQGGATKRGKSGQLASSYRFNATETYYVDDKLVTFGEFDDDLTVFRAAFIDGTEVDYSRRFTAGGWEQASDDIWYFDDKQLLACTLAADDTLIDGCAIDGAVFDLALPGAALRSDQCWYADDKQLLACTLGVDDTLLAGTFIDASIYGAAASTGAPSTPLPPILILADSLSANTGVSISYGQALATATGRTVYNLAIGGQTSRQQVITAGFKAVPATVANNQIVAGSNVITQLGEYAITGMSGSGYRVDNYQWMSTPADLATRTSKVQWGSLKGTVTRTATSATAESYTFVPDAGQQLPMTCPPGTPLVVLPANSYDECTVIFRTGRNDYGLPAVVLDSLQCVIDHTKHGRLIASSITNGAYTAERWSSSAPGSGWSTIFGLEQSIAAKLPGRFQPLRRKIIDMALSALAITPTAQDLFDQASDTVPWSLHLTESTGTLASAIGATDTAFTVTIATGGLSAGTVMKIEDEFVLIKAFSGANVTDCTRAYSGSATAHAAGTATKTIDKIHRSQACYGFEAQQDAAFLLEKGY